MAYRTEIEKLEQRYAENPKQWFAALADAYRKQGEVELAIEYIQGGIEERPNYASAHIVLGRCYLDKNLDDDAARAFEQVLELDAENIIALKSLAEIAERKSDLGGAQHWLNRLLEVDPMNEEAHESLARIEAAGHQEQAVPEAPAEEAAEAVAVAEEPFAPAEPDFSSVPEAVPADGMMDEAAAAPVEPGLTVSEEAVDAASVDVEPLELESTLPLDAAPALETDPGAEDGEPKAVIEPLEIETEDSDATSLLSGIEGGAESPDVSFETAPAIEPIEVENADTDAVSLLSATEGGTDGEAGEMGTTAEIEPIELEAPSADASSLFAGAADSVDIEDAGPEITAEIEPIELETPAADASSLVSGLGEFADEGSSLVAEASGTEPDTFDAPPVDADAFPPPDGLVPEVDSVVESVKSEVEPAAADEVGEGESVEELIQQEADSEGGEALQRASVPPTKEVDAVDLEALRAADEAIVTPSEDFEEVGEEASSMEDTAPQAIEAVEEEVAEELVAQDTGTPLEELSSEVETEPEEIPESAEEVGEELEVPEAAAAIDYDAELPTETEVEDDLELAEAGVVELGGEEVDAEPEAPVAEVDDEPAMDEVETVEEASGTTEIDLDELERLRAQDAVVASTAQDAESVERADLEPEFEEGLEAEPVAAGDDLGVVPFDDNLGWGAGDGGLDGQDGEGESEIAIEAADLAPPMDFLPDAEPEAVVDEVTQPVEDEAEDEIEAEAADLEPEMDPQLDTELEDVVDEAPEHVADRVGEAEEDIAAEAADLAPEMDLQPDAELEAVVDEVPESVAVEVEEVEEVVAEDEQTIEEPQAEEEAEEDLPLILPEDEGVGADEEMPEPEMVVTETMAEVYAKQGLLEQAREIYEVLVMQHADDARLKARLDDLNAQANAALQESRLSRFAVASTGGESAVSYLQKIFSGSDEPASASAKAIAEVLEPKSERVTEEQPTPLEEAFGEDPEEAPGEPTMPAADEVSLESVFDGNPLEPSSTRETPPEGISSHESDGENGVSFDEFYGSGASGQSTDEKESVADGDDQADDDDDFKSWLKGLKT